RRNPGRNWDGLSHERPPVGAAPASRLFLYQSFDNSISAQVLFIDVGHWIGGSLDGIPMRQIRLLAPIVILGLMAAAPTLAAAADILLSVNKTTQELRVFVDGAEHYKWPVSTARAGYVTPN